jgi:hypothetical protein
MKKMQKGPFRGPCVGLLIQRALVLGHKVGGRRVSASEALRLATSPDPRRPPTLLRFVDPYL